jgi:3-oxoacyl-[acyl-carrier-protein] synthase II
MMRRRRVVVTGMGLVSPLGNDVEEFWAALRSGRSGIARLRGPLASLPARIGGHVDLPAVPPDADSPAVAYALAAAGGAVRAAALATSSVDRRRLGVAIGANLRTPDVEGLSRILRRLSSTDGDSGDDPSPLRSVAEDAALARAIFSHPTASRLAQEYGAFGPCSSPAGACAAGSLAVISAARWIEQGYADVMLAGGSGCNLEPLTIVGYYLLGILASGELPPERSSRPFDRRRDGQVLSDGAGVLVVEEREHALRRGVQPLAEIAGWGCSAEARPLSTPDPAGRGAALAIRRALADANLEPADVDYVCAHAVALGDVDVGEINAIKTVFGRWARATAVSSIKSMIGNPVAGGGPIQLIASVLAIRDGTIPPTINLEDPDPACDLDCTPHHSLRRRVRAVVSNTFAFGGQNAAIVLRAPEAAAAATRIEEAATL